jgi:transposase-like protein
MATFPFCPNPTCPCHETPPSSLWYSRFGTYHTLAFGTVTRFICVACGKTFSSQTFSTHYYAKKLIDLKAILERHCASQSGRAIARALGLSSATVQNRLDRLARQSVALHSSLRPLADPHEAVSVDGFVSFDRSQFFPNELTISITHNSRFILELSHASHRRSGSMTPLQRRRAHELYAPWKPEKNAVGRTFRDILDQLASDRPPSPLHPLILITDEKPDYSRVLEKHPLFTRQDETHRVAHLTVNSHLPRTWLNPLFASNYLDREVRKDLANHHRESTCFTRNVANGLSRIACYIVHHNYMKKYLIKAAVSDTTVHAEAAGIARETLRGALEDFFTRRVFLSKCVLSQAMERIWKKKAGTPGKLKAEYLPRFALA